MSSQDDTFLFASLHSKKPSNARKVHIRRLYDIFQLCIAKRDLPRANRAWSILVRCKEINWATMWTTGLLLLGDTPEDEHSQTRLEYLRALMPQIIEEKEAILQELVLRLILCGQYKDALRELEFYLPNFPMQDNPVLHTYAGLLCLYLSQPTSDSGSDLVLLRDAQSHLDRALNLDPNNVVAREFRSIISDLRAPKVPLQMVYDDLSDDDAEQGHDDDQDDSDTPKAKRART